MTLPRRAAFMLPLALLGGCAKDRSPESTAREFIDRYYIERDHAQALEVATDGAAERVRSEQKLLQQAGSHEGPQPRVFYALEKQQPRGEDVELIYGLTIDSSGIKLHKRVLLRVKKEGAQYR